MAKAGTTGILAGAHEPHPRGPIAGPSFLIRLAPLSICSETARMTQFQAPVWALSIFSAINLLGLCVAHGQGATLTAGGFPVDRLSSGALVLLDQNGDLVQWPNARRPKISADPSIT